MSIFYVKKNTVILELEDKIVFNTKNIMVYNTMYLIRK